ncbi:gas vesicle protein [Streptomyces turgidiscabies]|uniref:Gas vesicle synthesis protein n=1 Tax=Streptomyces turgidiscabies (strain Car8) TaxID=698760 RepID=L7F4T2_STRT8|nr:MULTISPECIES: gas vesicle protein [Streptomyces]ELP65635.1 Gas vesicle synthesis protein [Streptomyces turgidiscabies Car8]MDX3498203.1 gas vesicle protein [Streptomyces turgidiscabies]
MAAAEPTRPRRVRPRPAENAEGEERPPTRRASGRRRAEIPDAASAMRSAAGQLAQLLGRPPDSVSSLKPTDDGWEAQVEVVELERIPDTTSVMASYKVALDSQGQLVSYERTRRYSRGMIDRPT